MIASLEVDLLAQAYKDNAVLPKVRATIGDGSTHFQDLNNRHFWRCMIALFDSGQPINEATMLQAFGDAEEDFPGCAMWTLDDVMSRAATLPQPAKSQEPIRQGSEGSPSKGLSPMSDGQLQQEAMEQLKARFREKSSPKPVDSRPADRDGAIGQSPRSPQSPLTQKQSSRKKQFKARALIVNRERKPREKLPTLNADEIAAIEKAMRATRPTPQLDAKGCNRALFSFASRLKTITRLESLPAPAARPFFDQWVALSLPIVGKALLPEWSDFLTAWQKARPYDWRWKAVVKQAREQPEDFALFVAEETWGLDVDPEFAFLVALCCALDQLHKGGAFPLACRMVAEALVGVGRTKAAQWIKLLADNSFLIEHTKTNKLKLRATRYRVNRNWPDAQQAT